MKGKILDETTAGKIKVAAREEFLLNGYDGATMQAIADRAGVNKAQLHYYYRSKDGIFRLIFQEEFGGFFIANLEMLKDASKSPREKLEAWIDAEVRFVASIPQLPLFLITEVNRNPALIHDLMTRMEIPALARQFMDLKGETKSGGGSSISIPEIMTMINSLLIFPIMAEPLLRHLLDLGPERWLEVQARQVELAKELLRKYLP